jgi:hypothetical protein
LAVWPPSRRAENFSAGFSATGAHGTLSSGDLAITVPASVTVPANGSTTLTVTVSTPQGSTVQGWVNLDGHGDNDLHFGYYAHVVP